MRIAFVGHSFHETTRSSEFFLELLQPLGRVTCFWDHSWRSGPPVDARTLSGEEFDAVVVWQQERVAEALARQAHPNVTFFPMFDSCHAEPDRFWCQLRGVKIVSFSSTLHHRLQRLGLRTRFARYYPDPARWPRVDHGRGLAAYFWQRQRDIDWAALRPVIGDSSFDRFTIHRAADPSFSGFASPEPWEIERHAIRFTDWFADRADALRDLAQHTVYFAPRLREGIGMSFLEAMAMGFLVVAPDHPTMNEYISPGVNGLLFEPGAPRPLDFCRHAELGTRAREWIGVGRERWTRSVPSLLEFVGNPTARHAPRSRLLSFDPLSFDTGSERDASPGGALPVDPIHPRADGRQQAEAGSEPEPLVTVFVVGEGREGGEALQATASSAARQDAPAVAVAEMPPPGAGQKRASPSGVSIAEAMNTAARVARSRFLLLLASGEWLATSDAISSALKGAPADVDLIVATGLEREASALETPRTCLELTEALSQLRRGDIEERWLHRLPRRPALLLRTGLLQDLPCRADLGAAADVEFLFRAVGRGARVHYSGTPLAVELRPERTLGAEAALFEELRRALLLHTESPDSVSRRLDAIWAERRRELISRQPWWRLASRPLDRDAVREVKQRIRTWRRRIQRRLRGARGPGKNVLERP